MHAGVRVEARERRRLGHLCRYAGRSAIAASRWSMLPDGRAAYELKRRWEDGTTHVVMTARSQLCVAGGGPFHRRLGSGDGLDCGGIRGRSCCGGCWQGRDTAASCGGLSRRGLGDVLRTFEIEVLVYPYCGGARRLLSAIGLSTEARELAPARSPPGEMGEGWRE